MPTSYDHADAFRRFLRSAGASVAISWWNSRTLHKLDKAVHRITGSRVTFTGIAADLPIIMLTTTGARSGQPRTSPLLGLVDGDRVAVIASNYGQRHYPAWYHNLRANPRATIVLDGVVRPVQAREADAAERDRLWQAALRVYPGYAAYQRRAAPRRIPVVILVPA